MRSKDKKDLVLVSVEDTCESINIDLIPSDFRSFVYKSTRVKMKIKNDFITWIHLKSML
jgi:hypothetical protein